MTYLSKKIVRRNKHLADRNFMIQAANDYNDKLLLAESEQWKQYYEEQMYVCLFLAFSNGELL